MTDMSMTIIAKSDQINAIDLLAETMVIEITDVKLSLRDEQPASIFYKGSDKAYKPCKGMRRVLVAIWGANEKSYIGKSMRLYRDPDAKWSGQAVGGVRISHMSNMKEPRTLMLTISRGVFKPHTVSPLEFESDATALKAALAAISTMQDKPSRDAARGLAALLKGSDSDVAKEAWDARMEALKQPSSPPPAQ